MTIQEIAEKGDRAGKEREVAEYVAKLKAEYAALSDEMLARWMQGHFEACRHAMEFDLPYSAAGYAWKLHKMWQEVVRRRETAA